jgi:hypothetical protein
MKKALVILILILVAAAVVFFFGWIQIRLPAGSYAVVFTKTGGYEDQVIYPGAFSWRWQRLVPTNLTLYRYELRPYSAELTIEESLPSAALYSRILPENPDLSFKATVGVQFSLRPESLPELARKENLTPDGLPGYYQRVSDALSSALAGRARQGGLAFEPGAGGAQVAAALREELEREFPLLEILDLQVRDLRLPDHELYALARDSYRSLVEARDLARNATAAPLAREREQEAQRLESLAAYGELLNKYPVLLKAMYVQHFSGKELINIPGFDLDKVLSGLESKAP